MTNAELIAKIKAEIERKYNYEKEMYCDTKPDGRPNDGWAESLAIMGVLEDLLSFLSTLESEKPVPNDLEEAAERIVVSLVPTFGQKYEDGSYIKGIRDYFSRDELIGLVKAGAEWLKEQGETYTTHVEDASNDEERFPAIFVPVDSFKPGDKVVVQIRKKY